MSSRKFALASLLAIVLASVAVETCSGQLLFRRRREALKAEMKWELQQQLNANLDSQVNSARSDLAQEATEQIKKEAAALKQSLTQEIAAMRAEADKIVESEKKRIARNAALEIAKIKSETNQKVESAKKELKATVSTSIASAEQDLKTALENYSKVLGNQNKDSFVKFQASTSKKFDSLKTEMESLIGKDVADQVQTAIKEQIAKSNKAMEEKVKKMISKAVAQRPKNDQPSEPKKKEAPEKKAVLNRVPRLTEESVANDDV